MNATNKTYTGVVYLIVNGQNNKKYVGQTVRDLNLRIKEHFCDVANGKRESAFGYF